MIAITRRCLLLVMAPTWIAQAAAGALASGRGLYGAWLDVGREFVDIRRAWRGEMWRGPEP